MKLKILAVSLLAFFAMGSAAQAIDGAWAVRQIRLWVDEDCNSPEARRGGFYCIGWDVYHCYKLSRRKVRCKAYQEYRHNGHRRTCYFSEALIEWPNHRRASFQTGRVECFNESL